MKKIITLLIVAFLFACNKETVSPAKSKPTVCKTCIESYWITPKPFNFPGHGYNDTVQICEPYLDTLNFNLSSTHWAGKDTCSWMFVESSGQEWNVFKTTTCN